MFVIEVGTVSKGLRRVTHSKSMCEPQETRRAAGTELCRVTISTTAAPLRTSAHPQAPPPQEDRRPGPRSPPEPHGRLAVPNAHPTCRPVCTAPAALSGPPELPPEQ